MLACRAKSEELLNQKLDKAQSILGLAQLCRKFEMDYEHMSSRRASTADAAAFLPGNVVGALLTLYSRIFLSVHGVWACITPNDAVHPACGTKSLQASATAGLAWSPSSVDPSAAGSPGGSAGARVTF